MADTQPTTTAYALFKNGKQISKSHRDRGVAMMEAFQRKAVLSWSKDFWSLQMADPVSRTTAHVLVIHGTHEATFTYRNWRGETSRRRVGVISIWHGSTEWHPEMQWFMHATDLEKMETRDFAMKDMVDVHFT